MFTDGEIKTHRFTALWKLESSLRQRLGFVRQRPRPDGSGQLRRPWAWRGHGPLVTFSEEDASSRLLIVRSLPLPAPRMLRGPGRWDARSDKDEEKALAPGGLVSVLRFCRLLHAEAGVGSGSVPDGSVTWEPQFSGLERGSENTCLVGSHAE